MFQKVRESAYLESTSLLILFVPWRKPLIIILLITLTPSCIYSSQLFLPPKYKSSVIFFPSATNSVSKALVDESNSEKQDILTFGEEVQGVQGEQMIHILNSLAADIANDISVLPDFMKTKKLNTIKK